MDRLFEPCCVHYGYSYLYRKGGMAEGISTVHESMVFLQSSLNRDYHLRSYFGPGITTLHGDGGTNTPLVNYGPRQPPTVTFRTTGLGPLSDRGEGLVTYKYSTCLLDKLQRVSSQNMKLYTVPL